MFKITEESYLPEGRILIGKGTMFGQMDREMRLSIQFEADGDPLLLKIIVSTDLENKETKIDDIVFDEGTVCMRIKNPHSMFPTLSVDRTGFATHPPSNSLLSIRFWLFKVDGSNWFTFIYELYREELPVDYVPNQEMPK